MELRGIIFITLVLAFSLAEHLYPRRERGSLRAKRWPINYGMMTLGFLVGRLTIGAIPIALATEAEAQGWGLLGWLGFGSLPPIFGIIVTAIVMDGVIYLQHVVFHKVPVLWRLHRIHHLDTDLDTSSGLRFHPLEAFLSLGIKIAAVALLGAYATGVLVFEIALSSGALFNHSNLRLPDAVDRLLRPFVVTPDMHRVHHSTIGRETNSNYGFCLSIWDRWCGTTTEVPKLGHQGMVIGSPDATSTAGQASLWQLLVEPFKAKT